MKFEFCRVKALAIYFLLVRLLFYLFVVKIGNVPRNSVKEYKIQENTFNQTYSLHFWYPTDF